MRQRGRVHYVKHNKVTRIPRTFIYLDSEAHQHESGLAFLQTFRLAVAAVDQRAHRGSGWQPRQWGEFDSPTALWDWVEGHCQPKARTVLVAHKLDYDLRICDALRELTNRGWHLENIRLDSTQAWASWKRDNCTLVMCDSLSWVNKNLAHIGAMLGIPKPALPAWEDSQEAWLARCRADVLILATLYRHLMEWVKDDDLGNWKPTGAGQAWAAFRHRFMTHGILVHDDEEAKAAERLAGWTGRCEAWQHGQIKRGPFYEWDYSAAYARIGYECKVPTQLLGEILNPSLEAFDKVSDRFAVLCECTVTTEVPTVPTDGPKGIIWPIGTFATTLWDTEIELAREYGATVEISRMWRYAKHPALKAFCRWCLDILDKPETAIDPIVRLAVKHWSRALIGRFGSKYSQWEEWGRTPWSDISLGIVQDVSHDEQWRSLQLGHQLFRQTAEADSQDAVPSVMTWVMAEARARLFRASRLAGSENVAYLDTDSLIVNRFGHEQLLAAGIDGFRVKGQWNTLEVFGPRQILTGGALRASGVPRGSKRVSANEWEGEVWSALNTSIANGEFDRVRITPRTVRISGKDSRRRHDKDGYTYPLAV